MEPTQGRNLIGGQSNMKLHLPHSERKGLVLLQLFKRFRI